MDKNCNYNPKNVPTCRKELGLTVVIIPAQSGDSEGVFAPKVGDYKNTIVKYLADSKVFVYDKDGNWTFVGQSNIEGVTIDTELSLASTNAVQNKVITKAINDLQDGISDVSEGVSAESSARELADQTLQGNIDAEALARQTADGTLQGNIDAEALARQTADGTLQDNIDAEALARSDAITGVETKIDRTLLNDLVMSVDADSVTFTERKINPNTGAITTEQDVIPTASTTTAGTISAAEYQSILASKELTQAILNGAVAISGLSPTVTQADLTNAWLTATGRTELINRASIFDEDNQLIWTYYTNAQLWYSATASISLDKFTNSTPGIILGSTTNGNVSANADGTGTVSGWAALVSDVAGKADSSSLATVATTGAYSDLSGTPTIPTPLLVSVTADYTNNTFTYTGATYSEIHTALQNGVPVTLTVSDELDSERVYSSGNWVVQLNTTPYGLSTTVSFSSQSYLFAFDNSGVGGTITEIHPANITMTSTDPGEGGTLGENEFIAVYSTS